MLETRFIGFGNPVRFFALRVVEFCGRKTRGEFVFGEFGLGEAAG